MSLALRPYQIEAIEAVKAGWTDGVLNQLTVIATGGGKTLTGLKLITDELGAQPTARCLWIAHRDELLAQPLERIQEFFPRFTDHCGIVAAERDETDRRLIFASIQTIYRPERLARIMRNGMVTHLVIDECFPAGTLVDGRPIETFKVGDTVTAYNEATGELTQSVVTQTFRNPAPERLVEIATASTTVYCTPAHPIFTRNGWTPAADLLPGDSVYVQSGDGTLHWEAVRFMGRRSADKTAALAADGFVYNLEVADFHTYLANGMVVHNCHHSTSDTYKLTTKTLQSANPALRHLGMTATPIRTDEIGLVEVYDAVAYRAGIKELIEQGFLCGLRIETVRTGISLDGVSSSGEDFNQTQLAQRYNTPGLLSQIVESHKKFAQDRQAIAFCADVETAERLAEKFSQHGIPAFALSHTTPNDARRDLLYRFRSGDFQVVCNYNILTEGTDLPMVKAIHMARPTRSGLTFVQMAGRALRLYPEHPDALIIDYVPSDAHNVIQGGDLLGKPRQQVKAEQQAEKRGVMIKGFSDTGDGDGLDADPDALVLMPLQVLTSSHQRWYLGGRGTASLGLGSRKKTIYWQRKEFVDVDVHEDLYLCPNDQPGPAYELWLIERWKEDGESRNRIDVLHAATEFETAQRYGESYADAVGSKVLTSKDAKWIKEPISPAQLTTLARMLPHKEQWLHTLSKGQASSVMTHEIARRAVERQRAYRRRQLSGGRSAAVA